jgi:hypothetical protein
MTTSSSATSFYLYKASYDTAAAAYALLLLTNLNNPSLLYYSGDDYACADSRQGTGTPTSYDYYQYKNSILYDYISLTSYANLRNNFLRGLIIGGDNYDISLKSTVDNFMSVNNLVLDFRMYKPIEVKTLEVKIGDVVYPSRELRNADGTRVYSPNTESVVSANEVLYCDLYKGDYVCGWVK